MKSSLLEWRSLKTRVTLFMLAIFVLSTWLLAFYASRMLREDLQRLLGQQQFSTVSVIAAGINSELADRRRALESVAANIESLPVPDAASLQTLLEQRPVLQGLFNGGSFITGKEGTAIASLPLSVVRVGVNYMEGDHVAAALREGRSTVSAPVLGKVLPLPVVSMAVPFRDRQGAVRGALVGVVDLSKPNFLDKIAGNPYGKSGGFVIVDRRHRMVVTGSDRQRIIEPLPAPGISPALDRFIQGNEGSEVFRNRLGVDVLASTKGLAEADWYVGVQLPMAEAFAPIRDLQQHMLVAAIFLTLLAGGLTWWMLRRQLAPLFAAVRTLAQLSATKQPLQPLPIQRQDEVGELIGGFNRLLGILGSREEALRDGHESLQSILATTLDGYWRVDDQGRLLDVNPAYCQLSGYSRGELLALRVSDLDDRESAAETAAHIELVMATGHDQFESRHRRKDGSLWHVEVSATYRAVAGGQIFVFLRNIDERKRAQEAQARLVSLDAEHKHLAFIVESSDNSITSVTLDGRYTSWNQGAEKPFGYRADEVLGRPLYDLMPASEVEAEQARLAQIARGESVRGEEALRQHRDGHPVHVSLSISPIRDHDGHVIGASRVALDISASKLAEAALARSNQRFRDLVDSTDGVVWQADARTFVFDYVSNNAERLLGYPVADWLEPGFWVSRIDPQDRDYAVQYCAACTGRLEDHDFEYRFIAQDGRVVWLRDIVKVVEEDGAPRWLRGLMIDITAQKLTEQSLIASRQLLAESAQRTQSILDNMLDAVVTINAQGLMESFNLAACTIFGYTVDEVLGRNVSLLMAEPHRSRHDGYLQRYQATGVARVVGVSREVEGMRKDGSVFPISLSVSKVEFAGKVTFIGLIHDNTEHRRDAEEIRRLASYDSLTGLPNRRLLTDRLRQAISASHRKREHGALMFLDLDYFKRLSDSQGHEVGDELLRQVAQRLRDCVRTGDSTARLGGDEFVVMLESLSGQSHEAATQAKAAADQILESLGRPYDLQGLIHSSTPSIGIVMFMGMHETIDDLLRKADVAMYQAKQAGRNTVRFFDPTMQAVAVARTELEIDLRSGLEKHEFVLHYQIQVDTQGATTGVEALVRWQHPTRGMVSPAQFIPLAEETGLILPLGQRVLETACAQLVQWAKATGTAQWTMAVNVSSSQFAQADFVDHVAQALHKTGANPWLLKLELTESMLVVDVEDVIAKMNAIRMQGVSFSLDDFGTGYSSLSYLKRLPLAQLKIDQSFVRDLLVDPSDAVIASTIVALGHSLGHKVIAEGVETLGQRDFLASIGCDAYQGYYFGRPGPAEALTGLVKLPLAIIPCGQSPAR